MSTWSYLRRLFGSDAAPASASSSAAVLERPVARRERIEREGAPVAPPDEPIDEFLERELGLAIEMLRTELPDALLTPDLQDLLDRICGDLSGQLRQLPSAAQQALSACDDPDVPTQALVPLFERDPILAKALLERANSAYYSRGGPPCLSLGPAIVRQGRRSAHNVILQQAMSGLVCRPGPMWNVMVSRIWSHMVRTGPIARAVAPAFQVDPEQAFALALLHDVGKLVVFDTLAAQRAATHTDGKILPVAMKRTLRSLHEPLGGLCALKWDLGADAARAIGTHHREPLPAVRNPLAEVIWLAERIDLDAQKRLPINLVELWKQGALGGDPAEATALLAAYHGDEAQTH